MDKAPEIRPEWTLSGLLCHLRLKKIDVSELEHCGSGVFRGVYGGKSIELSFDDLQNKYLLKIGFDEYSSDKMDDIILRLLGV